MRAPGRTSTRDRILVVATDLFGRRGVDAVSLDLIATEVGVAKQTLLYWFPSKDELLQAVVAQAASELAVVIEAAVRASGDDPLDRIDAVVTAAAVGIANTGTINVASTDALNPLATAANVWGSKTDIWGLGVTQDIDAAAMKLYMGWFNYSTDVTLISTTSNTITKSNPIDDMRQCLEVAREAIAKLG